MIRIQRWLVVFAILPFAFLGLRAIFWGSAAFFDGADPAATTTTPPAPPICTITPDPTQDQGGDTMTTSTSLGEIASSLLAQRDLELVSCNTIQSLWAGYGHVCAIRATRRISGAAIPPSPTSQALILKYISPPQTADIRDEGHLRKVLSYQVEQYFYTHLAPLLPESVAVAECIASINDGKTTALVLKDLKSSDTTIKPTLAFPVSLEKRGYLNSAQTFAALDWLAGFHGHFWGKTHQLPRDQLVRPPLEEAEAQVQKLKAVNGAGHSQNAHVDVTGVWLNGGYTYLATRRKEYASLVRDREYSEWSAILTTPSSAGGPSLAQRVAAFLTPSSDLANPGPVSGFETLIHGDVKSENMFASATGEQVAFVDFQYVGLGLGVCDLAKLFTCSVPLSLLVEDQDDVLSSEGLDMQPGEKKLLQHYVRSLENISGKEYPWDVFVRHWEVALVDWLRFQASWGFWGNTEWLEARVRHVVQHIDI